MIEERIKGVIFDVDGTLLDSMGIWEDAGARYLQSLHIEAETGLGDVLEEMTIEEAAVYMQKRYTLSQTIEEIIQGILGIVKDFYYEEASLKPKVKKVLEEFYQKGIPMVIATSSEKDHLEKAFGRLEIRQYFQNIFTCSEVGTGKTSPQIYELSSQFMGTTPEETLVFEDVLHAVRTAKNAGFVTVGIYDRFSEKDQEEIKRAADIYLRDWSEWKEK